MSDRDHFLCWKLSFTIFTLLLLSGAAHAYVGPEADPATLGYFFSLLAWVFVAVSSLMLWPIYALIRFLRRGRAAPETPSALSSVAPTEGTTLPAAPDALPQTSPSHE
jgi:hypothetical protein